MRRAAALAAHCVLMVFALTPARSAAVSGKPDLGGETVQSAWAPQTGEWQIAWPGRVAQYDLAYASPPVDPLQGLPLGNGDVGVLFWCEGSKLIAVVNKCDLWDDAAFGRFRNWSPEEEDYSTTLRHACRIVIDFKVPVFDVVYLSDFSARLHLAQASLSLSAGSAFGRLGVQAFVDHKTGALLCDLQADLKEDIPVSITLERYGSRTFSHWYSQINRDVTIGIDGTEALADSSGAYLIQALRYGRFAVGAQVLEYNRGPVDYARRHSRCSEIILKGSGHKKARWAVAVTSPEEKSPLANVQEALQDIRNNGLDTMRSSHEQIWKSIWLRSFMDFGDAYLNNLWHLTIYYAHASQGGRYPGRFNNGLWTWSRDVQNWNYYFHWNQQQLYWPLNAAGYPELAQSYLNYRFDSLPQAQADAREFFHTDGAYFSDVSERRGYNSAAELMNHTPVAEIALDFWRQYCYTGDQVFLREQALPFIIEAAKFFTSLFKKGEDGLYHAVRGSGYEGWIELRDGLTELVYGRALMAIVLQASEAAQSQHPQAALWQEMLDHFAPLPVVAAEDSMIAPTPPVFRRGYHKGRPAPGNSILAAGWGIKESKWLTVLYPGDENVNHGFKLLDGIFPSVPSSPVFPSGLIGLSQKGQTLFDVMQTTILLYGPEATGWDPVPIVLARLGLAEELAQDLERFPQRWQIYVNGWGHWGLEGEINKDAGHFFRSNQVRDVSPGIDSEARFPLPMWPFRHMSMESMSVLATAMNEALLQSHDGVIRIMPATTARQAARFTLHSRGGFIVSAEKNAGRIEFVAIKSLLGHRCRVESPWPKASLYSGGRKIMTFVDDPVLQFNSQAGELLLLLPDESPMADWTTTPEAPAPNQKARSHSSGKAQLGLERMF